MAHVVAFGGVAAAAPARVSARKSWPARSPMVALPARRVGVVVAAKKSAPSAPPAPAPVEAPAPVQAAEATGVPPPPQGFVPPPPPPGFNPPPPPLPVPQAAPGSTQAQQQAYPPQGYYYPPPQKKGGDTPGWMLVGLGVALAVGFGKVMEFVGGKKGDMQSMMLQQMMKQMGNQAGGAPGMGGMPGMGGTAGGAAGAGGFPPFPPPNFTPPKPAAAASPGVVDVKPTEDDAKPTEKKEAPKPAAPAAATATATATEAKEEKKEEEKKESGSVGSGSFFADATDEAGPSTKANPFAAAETETETVTGEPVGEGDEEEDLEYMQNMLRNPQMQEMMYPYLPEMMRNPETFEMLLSNPMYKDQLKGIMKQMKEGGGGFSPGEGMPDMNSPEVQEQFAAMGMTPQDAIQKLMGDPELAMAFQNPKIQQAVMDCSSNPNNIVKYQSDPEIMNVFMKLATMFPGAGGGMPPSM